LLCNRYAAPAKLPIWQMSRNKTLDPPEGEPIGSQVSTVGSSRCHLKGSGGRLEQAPNALP